MKVTRAVVSKPGIQLPWGFADATLTDDLYEMRLLSKHGLLEVAKRDKRTIVRTTYVSLNKIDCLDTAEPLSQPGRPPKHKDE